MTPESEEEILQEEIVPTESEPGSEEKDVEMASAQPVNRKISSF